METLESIWNYKLQIIPVTLFILIYQTPALLRRLKKVFYVPIYFLIYPLREINQDLSIYLGDNVSYGGRETVPPEQVETLRKQIKSTSVISASIDALVVPLTVGFLAAFVLKADVFSQCVGSLAVYKLVTIIQSLCNPELYLIQQKWKTPLLISIYTCYLGMIVHILRTTYSWAAPYVGKADWLGLWDSFSAFVFGTILAQNILFALLVAGP